MTHPWHDVTPGERLPGQFVVETWPVIEHALERYSQERRRGF
jgi:hypothetical protein